MPANRIQDKDKQDRPREKLLKHGAENLAHKELIQILLGSGNKERDVVAIAQHVLKVMEQEKNITAENLRKVKGLGEAKITLLLAALELGNRRIGKGGRGDDVASLDPENIWEAMYDIRKATKEHFVIVLLNSRDKEIAREVVSIGTISASLVHPREVFEVAIRNKAVSVIGVHNHPSGDVNPSDADLQITKRLVEAGNLLGVEFYDHIIVTEPKRGSSDKHYSIREHHEELFD